MAQYKKIITHDGTFHADEILAIATLYEFAYDVSKLTFIERKSKVLPEEYDNTSIIILDVGEKHNPILNNFDHHQNPFSPSTCILVLKKYCVNDILRSKLIEHLYQQVSDIDKGIIIDDNISSSFNSIIRNFNNIDNGFKKAITVTSKILKAIIATTKLSIASELRWNNILSKQFNNIVVTDDKEPIIGWKELAKRDNIFMLVCPNSRGGYQIISRDSNEFVIPVNESQTFRHNSGFMAVYPDKETAIRHAEIIVPSLL